jgi:probable F420-dependent oxidoreductase
VTPERLSDVVRRAEELGYDSVWVGEHIVLPMVEKHTHPYGQAGVVTPRHPRWEPFGQLAFIAGQTERLRLATGVIIAPIRNLFATARQIVTLDVFSKGRLDLGVGVGWHGGEFDLMGADFANRGAHTDEFIGALDRLFTEETPSFQGQHIAFEPVGFEPKPLQKPRVPVFVGGDSAPAMRRAARLGDGWYGHAKSPEEGRARIDTVRRLLSEYGRGAADFQQVLQVWNPPDRNDLRAYAGAGADRLVISPFKADLDPIEIIEDYALRIDLSPTGAGVA